MNRLWLFAACAALIQIANAQESFPDVPANHWAYPKRIDPRALAVMRKNQEAMAKPRSFEAIGETAYVTGEGAQTAYTFARLIAVKPNLSRYEEWVLPKPWNLKTSKLPAGSPYTVHVSTGKKSFMQRDDEYWVDTAHRIWSGFEPWKGFLKPEPSAFASLSKSLKDHRLSSAQWLGRKRFNGKLCDDVRFATRTGSSHSPGTETDEYLVGARDHLIKGLVTQIPGVVRMTSKVEDIKLDQSFNPVTFTYKPPKGVLLISLNQLPTPAPKASLQNGVQASDFEAIDMNGKKERLSDFRGKVVLLDFWASWCGPCRESMPHTQSVVKKLQDAGVPVVALAVDDGEKQDGFTAWVKNNQSKYANLNFLFSDPNKLLSDALYKVTAIPTQFIIDKQGVVRASFVGYGGPTDDLENAIRAAAK